jgi:hypothetical protein
MSKFHSDMLMHQPSSFFQHFAQPPPQSTKLSKRVRDYQPPDYTFLASGGYGDVYQSQNSTTVLKLFSRKGQDGTSQENVIAESQKLDDLGRIAPDYVPVPCASTRFNQTLAIQMPNVGNTLSKMLPFQEKRGSVMQRLPILDPDEIALCMLQSIHFILLINDRMKMDDVHPANVCVQGRKENIRFRFIDVGLWHKYEPEELFVDEIRTCWIDIVGENAQKLFQDDDLDENGLWREVLTEYLTAGPNPQEFGESCGRLMQIVDTFNIKGGANIYSVLLNMAERIQEVIRAMATVCTLRGDYLLQKIREAEIAARLRLRPSERPSMYSKKRHQKQHGGGAYSWR